MYEKREQTVSVINISNNPNRRRPVTAKSVRKRRKRKKKARIYARLAVLVSVACVVLFLGISLVSMTVNAISGIFGGGDAHKTNSNILSNNHGIVNSGNNEPGKQNSGNNINNGGEQQTSGDESGEEPSDGHIIDEEPDKLEYGDDLYNDGEFVVCIDPGHGGNDVGCVGADDSYEKNDVLKLSQYIVHLLEQKGVKVITTRSTDVWVNLEDRPAFANEHNADLLLSLHRNNYEEDESVKGFEAWINSTDSDNSNELAGLIMAGLENAGISKNRGVKKGSQGSTSDNYAVNIGSRMPSVLLEMGFMSSPTDNQLFRSNTEQYAKVIVEAIIQWSQGKQY